MKCPTEIAISDRREAELAKNGFMPLLHKKNSDIAAFIGAQSLQNPAEYDDPDATANANLAARLPYLFAAFRISIPLSVIGAVVGEWFSGDRGLGSVIIVAHNNLDMPTLFSAILALASIGIALTILTSFLEKRVLFWHDSAIAT